MSKIKIDTRVEPETYDKIMELKKKVYFGNKSLCIREIIESGLSYQERLHAKMEKK